MIRERFEQQLSLLHDNLTAMGALIEEAIERAAYALEHQDAALARQIIESDSVIDDKEKEIESLCLKLILREQPVARDLGAISTALKVITDMERIGDHASDISEICIHLSGQNYIKKLVHIPRMAEEARTMVSGCIQAFVTRDAARAREVIAQDDIVDGLFITVKKELIAALRENAEHGDQAFDLLQIAKYYERIGDHAVNIAEWVIFLLTGKHKNTQVL